MTPPTAAAKAAARAASAGMLLGDREAEARGRGAGPTDASTRETRLNWRSPSERAGGAGELTAARASPYFGLGSASEKSNTSLVGWFPAFMRRGILFHFIHKTYIKRECMQP